MNDLCYEVVNGNLLDAKETFIVHQCNCVGETAGGVARVIFEKWPEANDYIRHTHGQEGTIKVHKVEKEKYVVNMFSQFLPGGMSEKDGPERRLKAFIACITELALLEQQENLPHTFAFPYFIGCSIAGGDWKKYEMMLNIFAYLIKSRGGKVVLYKLD